MKFTPKNKENRKPFLLEGEDVFTIIDAKEKLSYHGNAMCEIVLKRPAFPYGIRCWLVFDESESSHYFIEQFFLSIGMPYPENGDFEVSELIGKEGRALFGFKRSVESLGNSRLPNEPPPKRYLEAKRFIVVPHTENK